MESEGSCRLWKAAHYAKSIAKNPTFREKTIDLLFIIQHDFVVTINKSTKEVNQLENLTLQQLVTKTQESLAQVGASDYYKSVFKTVTRQLLLYAKDKEQGVSVLSKRNGRGLAGRISSMSKTLLHSRDWIFQQRFFPF